MRPLLIFGAVAVLAVGGAIGLAHSGLIDVSASANEPTVVRWLLRTTRESSVRQRAADIAVPDLSAEAHTESGARAFGEMCAGCHGAPGREPMLGAQDMNPPPPDLAETANARTPAELFWVIQNGIRMTGMPAWGPTHSDAQIWELVAFIERLPEVSADDFRQMATRSGGDDHGHDHGRSAPKETEEPHPGGHTH